MAKVWPLPSSTVVSARRTVSAGTTEEPPVAVTVTAFRLLSSLTSGATWIEMRPSLNSVGRKLSETP